MQEADEGSKRAVAVGRDDQRAWQFRTGVLAEQGRLEAALEANAEAVRLDATSGGAILQRGWLMILMGKPAEALALVDKAIALNPNVGSTPGRAGSVALYRCQAFLALGRYDDAIAACQKSVVQADYWVTHLFLVAAYAQRGDAAQAAAEKAALLKKRPGVSIAEYKAINRNVGQPAYLQQTETYLYAGLRTAGIPEE